MYIENGNIKDKLNYVLILRFTRKGRIMESKPNIILINCDDLGYGDLACYGSKINKTPYLDKLATEGLKLTDFYMASPICSPSRGAMLTGCYPPRIGFGSFDGDGVLFPGHAVGLNQKEITIAKLLKTADYKTKLIGKWHCGDQEEFLPTKHGFDSYYGIPYSNDMGRQNHHVVNPPLPLLRDEEVIQEQPDQTSLTERYTEEAVSYIRENKNNPFFLYLAHMYVHLPIYPPDRFLKESKNGRYGAAVACIDWVTGVIMDELKRQDLENNTLIIFTSDNGSRARDEGGSNAPLRGLKGETWEGGMRLPCIMKWPKKIPAGKVSSELTTSMDFFPTIANICNLEIPNDRIIDGKDISDIIFDKNDAKTPHDCFYYYFMNNLEAIRSGKWKLHVRKHKKEILELYDLENDIGETENICDKHPEIVKDLKLKMDKIREDIGDDALEIKGKNNRPNGRVQNPKPLTEYNPEHPYIEAMYDLNESG